MNRTTLWAALALFAIVETAPAADVAATKSRLTPAEQQAWRKTLTAYDYVGIAKAYADYMITYGRDTYGKKHTPLFITGLDRHSGKMIKPPFAHVKRKPFMPGWERDRELRGSDRNYGQADPLDQLTLLKLMHRLSADTGDKHYAEEAQCASCHRKIDPIGFGLENFTAAGKWRTHDGRGKRAYEIDPSGKFHKGPEFANFFELRDRIAEKENDFARGFTEHLIGYGLGRPFGFTDEDLAVDIITSAKKEEFSVIEFIQSLVQSKAFATN